MAATDINARLQQALAHIGKLARTGNKGDRIIPADAKQGGDLNRALLIDGVRRTHAACACGASAAAAREIR
jgi:hypothetical protein